VNNNIWCWGQIQFSSAKTINKATIRTYGNYSGAGKQITIKASNTGAFSGEETTVYTSAADLTWGNNETKTFTFSNGTAYTYYRTYHLGNNTGALETSEIEMMECA